MLHRDERVCGSQWELLLHRLPDRIVQVLEAIALEVNSFQEISTIKTGSDTRGSFRFDLNDGSKIKLRLVSSASLAKRIQRVSDQLPQSMVAKVVDREGHVLIESWVDGEVLSTSDCTPEVFRKAGSWQGQLHTLPTHEFANEDPLVNFSKSLLKSFEVISAAFVIEQFELDSLREMLETTVPKQVDLALIHSDFCPENIVRQDQDFVAIDNGGLAYSAAEFDLARTKYRWPMSMPQWQSFVSGYSECRSIQNYSINQKYWDACVLVKALAFYCKIDSGKKHQLSDRLRVLLDLDRRGVA